MSTIKKEDAIFIAIDFQERLLPAMNNCKELEATMVKMAEGMKVLNIPTIVTQQYTKGLGSTTQPIAEALGRFEPIDKTTFSALGQEAFINELKASGKKTTIITGIETHICVQQTAIDLLEKGYNVYVVKDCVASRKDSDNLCSQERMARAGAVITTYESVLYELLGGAKAEGFKAISAIVK
ncbi:MAG: hydrolase [Anaerovoracaceae bacterium]